MPGTPPPPPLTPAVFAILVALADGEKHGYAILQESRPHIVLGPGTLYGTLDRLLNSGLVEEIERSVPAASIAGSRSERRRYYRLTGAGRQRLAAETARLELALQRARSKGVGASEVTA